MDESKETTLVLDPIKEYDAACNSGCTVTLMSLCKRFAEELREKRAQKDRLEIIAEVFAHLRAHLDEGGTFRYLIYDRLGLGPESYAELYGAGGMRISNAFCRLNELEKKVADGDLIPIETAFKLTIEAVDEETRVQLVRK